MFLTAIAIVVVGAVVSATVYVLITFINIKAGITDEMSQERINLMKYLSFANGIMEFSLYTTALYLQIPQLLVLWIGVKTALRWFWKSQRAYLPGSLWPIDYSKVEIPTIDENKTISEENFINKLSYLKFLLGNGIVLICSYIMASCLNHGLIHFDNL